MLYNAQFIREHQARYTFPWGIDFGLDCDVEKRRSSSRVAFSLKGMWVQAVAHPGKYRVKWIISRPIAQLLTAVLPSRHVMIIVIPQLYLTVWFHIAPTLNRIRFSAQTFSDATWFPWARPYLTTTLLVFANIWRPFDPQQRPKGFLWIYWDCMYSGSRPLYVASAFACVIKWLSCLGE